MISDEPDEDGLESWVLPRNRPPFLNIPFILDKGPRFSTSELESELNDGATWMMLGPRGGIGGPCTGIPGRPPIGIPGGPPGRIPRGGIGRPGLPMCIELCPSGALSSGHIVMFTAQSG